VGRWSRSTACHTTACGRRFAQLTEAEQRGFVNNMRQNKVEGWQTLS
jgi:hypothetical protein